MKGWAHKHSPWRRALRDVRHAIEAVPYTLVMGIAWLLPVDRASAMGGWVARKIGPRLSMNRRALRHLALAFPDMPEAERRRIALAMWENLGRFVAEYPHLAAIADPASGRIEVRGEERLAALRAAGRPFILISAHMANFELMPASAHAHGYKLTVVARPINNRFIYRILLYFRDRSKGNQGELPKGIGGALQAAKLLKQGINVGILVDQRSSQGVALPLFGRPARTTLGAAKLAIAQGIEIFPAHLERVDGVHFRLIVEEPLQRPQTDDRQEVAKAMMTQFNEVLERWVRNRPEDWLWLHRRWDRP